MTFPDKKRKETGDFFLTSLSPFSVRTIKDTSQPAADFKSFHKVWILPSPRLVLSGCHQREVPHQQSLHRGAPASSHTLLQTTPLRSHVCAQAHSKQQSLYPQCTQIKGPPSSMVEYQVMVPSAHIVCQTCLVRKGVKARSHEQRHNVTLQQTYANRVQQFPGSLNKT